MYVDETRNERNRNTAQREGGAMARDKRRKGGFFRFLIKLIVFVIIVIAAIFGLAETGVPVVGDAARAARTQIVMLIDRNEAARQAADALAQAQADALAMAADMTTEQAERLLGDLDFNGWKTTELPDTVTPLNTIQGDVLGSRGSITVYDNLNYVTIGVNDYVITLSVPQDAQQKLAYLLLL